MSSLSDHFALNTTLRNFCFSSHRHYFTKKHSRFNFMLAHWSWFGTQQHFTYLRHTLPEIHIKLYDFFTFVSLIFLTLLNTVRGCVFHFIFAGSTQHTAGERALLSLPLVWNVLQRLVPKPVAIITDMLLATRCRKRALSAYV